METYDAVLEFVSEVRVRPTEPPLGFTHKAHAAYMVVIPEYVEQNFSSNTGLLIAHIPASQQCVPFRKLIHAILHFSSHYNSLDECRISFLLWYADLLCQKRHKNNFTGLHYDETRCVPEGIAWTFISRDRYSFAADPDGRTRFFYLHTMDTGCFTPEEFKVLQDVSDGFRVWMAGYEDEVDPSKEGGARELMPAR